jgi:hypothetical protein
VAVLILTHRLVAPMMKTVFLEFMPSISVSSWFSTRSAAPPASPALRSAGTGDAPRQHSNSRMRNPSPTLPITPSTLT